MALGYEIGGTPRPSRRPDRSFIWRPGGGPANSDIVATTWEQLFHLVNKVPGPVNIVVDASIAPPQVPAGLWAFNFSPFWSAQRGGLFGISSVIIDLLDGAMFPPEMTIQLMDNLGMRSLSNSPIIEVPAGFGGIPFFDLERTDGDRGIEAQGAAPFMLNHMPGFAGVVFMNLGGKMRNSGQRLIQLTDPTAAMALVMQQDASIDADVLAAAGAGFFIILESLNADYNPSQPGCATPPQVQLLSFDAYLAPSSILAPSNPYTVTVNDRYIAVDASAAPVPILLPDASTPRELTIKKTDATPNTVDITPSGLQTIDGVLGPLALGVQNQARKLVTVNGNWQIMAAYL